MRLILSVVFLSALVGSCQSVPDPGGDPPWQRHVIDNTSRGADGVKFADVNRDGREDIVTGWEEGGLVRLYLHPGQNAVRKPWPKVTLGEAPNVEDAVAIDLDGDGIFEVLASCEGSEQTLYLYRSSDTDRVSSPEGWQRETVPVSRQLMRWMYATELEPGFIAAGGKDAEAALGLLSTHSDHDVSVWQFLPLASVGWIMSIRATDMDADGDRDLLFTDRKGAARGVWWLENPGDMSNNWTARLIGGGDREVMFLDLADLDGDGLEDIVVATHGGGLITFRRLDRTGSAWSRFDIPPPDGAGRIGKGVAVGDVDGDGRIDIVYSCENAETLSGIVWLSALGSPWEGEWRSRDISGPQGVKFDQVILIDVDADGDLDVVTCEEVENLGVIWYENPGNTESAL